MSCISLEVTGTDAETIARELAEQLWRHLGIRVEPTRVGRDPYSLDALDVTRGDPLALATFVLAIPPSLLAAVQLVDRVQRWEVLRDWARRLDPGRGGVAVKGTESVPLAQADVEQVLEAAAGAAPAGEGAGE